MSDTSEVPEGTISDVEEWVGNDPDRAATALEAERSGKARKTLISTLESLADAAPEPEPQEAVMAEDETTTEAPAIEDPAPVAEEVTGEAVDADDSVVLEEDLLRLSLPRRAYVPLTTVAASAGQRVSAAYVEEVKAANAEVEAEAEKRTPDPEAENAGTGTTHTTTPAFLSEQRAARQEALDASETEAEDEAETVDA